MSEIKTAMKQLAEEKRELEKAIATLVQNFQGRTGTRVTEIRFDELYHALDNVSVVRCFVDLELNPDGYY